MDPPQETERCGCAGRNACLPGQRQTFFQKLARSSIPALIDTNRGQGAQRVTIPLDIATLLEEGQRFLQVGTSLNELARFQQHHPQQRERPPGTLSIPQVAEQGQTLPTPGLCLLKITLQFGKLSCRSQRFG